MYESDSGRYCAACNGRNVSNILLLSRDFPPTSIGGVSAWSNDLADALHHAGHAVVVVTKKDGDTTRHDAEKPYPIVRARGRSWSKWQHVWMRIAAGPYVQKDTLVIAATWPHVSALTRLIRRRKARLALAFHGSEITTRQEAPKSLSRVLEAANLLLPVSNFLRDELIRLGFDPEDRRVRILPMPLTVTLPEHHQERHNLICVARDTSRKGIERAINIAALTGETLELIGPVSGPPGTIAHGPLPREKTLEIMQTAKAIILTPKPNDDGLGEEGLGLVLLEAAARGVPAIGCYTGGVPEAVGPGLLLRDPDNPDIKEIRTWLRDTTTGAKALAWVRQHHGPAKCLQVLHGDLS